MHAEGTRRGRCILSGAPGQQIRGGEGGAHGWSAWGAGKGSARRSRAELPGRGQFFDASRQQLCEVGRKALPSAHFKGKGRTRGRRLGAGGERSECLHSRGHPHN
jgi:hypothetical protein